MAWIKYNPNPRKNRRGQPRRVKDCVVRAFSRATGLSWEESYLLICAQGFHDGDMPSSDAVWGERLRRMGFERIAFPACPPTAGSCYSVADFADDNPRGIFVIGTGEHAVCVANGDYYDTWDSGDESPSFVWMKGE